MYRIDNWIWTCVQLSSYLHSHVPDIYVQFTFFYYVTKNVIRYCSIDGRYLKLHPKELCVCVGVGKIHMLTVGGQHRELPVGAPHERMGAL